MARAIVGSASPALLVGQGIVGTVQDFERLDPGAESWWLLMWYRQLGVLPAGGCVLARASQDGRDGWMLSVDTRGRLVCVLASRGTRVTHEIAHSCDLQGWRCLAVVVDRTTQRCWSALDGVPRPASDLSTLGPIRAAGIASLLGADRIGQTTQPFLFSELTVGAGKALTQSEICAYYYDGTAPDPRPGSRVRWSGRDVSQMVVPSDPPGYDLRMSAVETGGVCGSGPRLMEGIG